VAERLAAIERTLTGRADATLIDRDDAVARLDDAFGDIRRRLDRLDDSIWASKVVRVDDRLLAGCRHANLVFLLDAHDQLLTPRFVVDGEYEPHTTAFLKRVVEHDDVCLDVGANFGYYTCLFSHLAWNGRVLAYEADPDVHRLLVENVAINWSEPNVETVNAAVGARAGELTLHRWINRAGNSGIIPPPEGWVVDTEQFTVEAVTLDALVGTLPKVDVVKIDVEGAESMVVAGMSSFIDEFRPTVVLE